MDLIEKLEDIAHRIQKTKNQVETEEATKTAFVMPFLSALGYDVFNPLEVIPEYTADLGTKKGEKVDYCILQDGKPAIIIECKHWKEPLNVHTSQLHRYFHVLTSRFAIITNGIDYQFYSDLEEANKMDDKAFFEFSFENINENVAGELKKFQKQNFDVDSILDTASDLKYSKAIKELLSSELKAPSDDFVKHFASRVYNGRITSKIQEQFQLLVQKSSKQLITDMVSDRLKTALTNEQEESKTQIQEVEEKVADAAEEIVTTEEEMEAFRIIQAIARKKISLDRLFFRDHKRYFGVIVDDNNRKPLCRFWFNSRNKYISVFGADKKEEKVMIDSLEDIYQHDEKILQTLDNYQ